MHCSVWLARQVRLVEASGHNRHEQPEHFLVPPDVQREELCDGIDSPCNGHDHRTSKRQLAPSFMRLGFMESASRAKAKRTDAEE